VNIAVTVACHRAGHELLGAVSAIQRLRATVATAATHAAVNLVVSDGLECLQEFKSGSLNAVYAQDAPENVDDVFHYCSVYIS
jgi:hypothetical protein